MAEETVKVGIIACSGEEIAEGTISRLATRRVLELLRPETTVTLCLPLFLAGGEGEREFARRHPTIAVDGCDKQCAKYGTEKYSGPVSAGLVVTDILKGSFPDCRRSLKEMGVAEKAAVWAVADRIVSEADAILEQQPQGASASPAEGEASCACSRPLPAAKIRVNGTDVPIVGLPILFDQLVERGLPAEDSSGDELVKIVNIYHPIAPEEAAAYRAALVEAYRAYRAQGAP